MLKLAAEARSALVEKDLGFELIPVIYSELQELTSEFFGSEADKDNWIEHCLNELNINLDDASSKVLARL